MSVQQQRVAQEIWQKEMARKTYQKLLALLNPTIAKLIEHPKEDPKIVDNGDRNRMRIRILPVKSEMHPGGFWGRNRCFYEILVDPWKQELGSCLGEVEFFRYANQPNGSGNKFTPKVSGLLQKFRNESTQTAQQGFILILPDKESPKFFFQRRYYANYARDFKSYPCDAAAKDLAWLISKTLPELQALQ